MKINFKEKKGKNELTASGVIILVILLQNPNGRL